MNDSWVAVASSLITGVGAYLVGANANKTTLQKAAEATDLDMEKFYATNMTTIIAEYKEQVSGLREDVSRLNNKIDELDKKYEKDITAYQNQVEFLEEKVEDLEVENSHLKEENKVLRGGN